MLIRKYNPNDRPAVLELFRLNTPAFFAPAEENDLVDYLAGHAQHYYVVEENGIVLGCGGFNTNHPGDDNTTARISWDIFHPQSQGKGLGTALTAFRLREIAAMPGIKTIVVRTTQLVYPFYEKFGFKTVEIIKDYWAPGFDLYHMERGAGLQ